MKKIWTESKINLEEEVGSTKVNKRACWNIFLKIISVWGRLILTLGTTLICQLVLYHKVAKPSLSYADCMLSMAIRKFHIFCFWHFIFNQEQIKFVRLSAFWIFLFFFLTKIWKIPNPTWDFFMNQKSWDLMFPREINQSVVKYLICTKTQRKITN